MTYLSRCGYVVRRTPKEILAQHKAATECLRSISREPLYDAFPPCKSKLAPQPAFRMCVVKFQERIPSMDDVAKLSSLGVNGPLRFAVVDQGAVSFFDFSETKL
eukprot:c10165_g1_i3.p2 GENE.c10165_g1_i3~~c10165_g1_i3.p2  ORF type:complete len:104 (+),score=18.43 c10165_g1_i3:713-1024(+)